MDESFNLKLLYGPLPKDITAIFMNNNALDNFNYGQITRKGISSIKFVDINFRETNMNRDKECGGKVYIILLGKRVISKESGETNDKWRLA